MKDPSIFIFINFFIFMILATIKWLSKGKFTLITKLTYLYMIIYIFVMSIIITDSALGLIYTVLFGFIIMYTIWISNQDLKSGKVYIFIASVIVSTAMFIFISRFVLVKSLALMFIYFLPPSYIMNHNENQLTKYKITAGIGLSLILLVGLFYNSDKTIQYPTKQSFIAIEYLERNYPDEKYQIYSMDSMRGGKTIVTIYMESKEKPLLLEYEDSSIINVLE